MEFSLVKNHDKGTSYSASEGIVMEKWRCGCTWNHKAIKYLTLTKAGNVTIELYTE